MGETQVSTGDNRDEMWIERIRSGYSHCFGCGRSNGAGLNMDGFIRSEETVTARFTPRVEHCGFEHVLHGGVLATALDEILAWTAILVAGTMAVTAKLDLVYRKPAAPDVEYQVEGRLVERRGRRLTMEAQCSLDGSVIAQASGLFLASDLDPVPTGTA